MIIFIKERTRPLTLQVVDALTPRLHKTHPQLPFLKEQAAKLQKGYNGERKLDYYLNILSDEFSILNDITLKNKQNIFQIDSIVMTNHAIFIIESKSLEGVITLDTNLQQLVQTYQNKKFSYKYPITQLENIKFQFMQWLEQHQLSGLPIFYFLSIADSSSILNVIGDQEYLRQIVTFTENIPMLIMQKNDKLKKVYKPNSPLKNKVITTIMSKCEDFQVDILKQFRIKKEDILPGIVCNQCYQLDCEYIFNSAFWYCKNCHHKMKHAHKRALNDYF